MLLHYKFRIHFKNHNYILNIYDSIKRPTINITTGIKGVKIAIFKTKFFILFF